MRVYPTEEPLFAMRSMHGCLWIPCDVRTAVDAMEEEVDVRLFDGQQELYEAQQEAQ